MQDLRYLAKGSTEQMQYTAKQSSKYFFANASDAVNIQMEGLERV